MIDLGEILNNSKLILDLLTKGENDEPAWADNPPSAIITYTDGLSVIEVANVKLNEMGNIGEYSYELEIPAEWTEGDYIITYTVTINGIESTSQKTFKLKYAEGESEEEPKEELVIPPIYGDVTFGDRDKYIMPPEFQVECELIVTEKGVLIKPKESLKYNHTYTLVLGKNIQSITKEKVLGNTEHLTFTSAYSPLYATPLEVRAVIRNFFQYFTVDEIYTALRDAGEKAHVYKDLVPDANNSRFKMAQDRETFYFAMTKYQVYEASRVLLTKLLMYLLQGNAGPNDGIFGGAIGDLGFTLGDLTVAGGRGGPDADTISTQKRLLEDLIGEIEKDLKFWQDSMLGHHRRTYAKPTSSSFRTAGGSPESREI